MLRLIKQFLKQNAIFNLLLEVSQVKYIRTLQLEKKNGIWKSTGKVRKSDFLNFGQVFLTKLTLSKFCLDFFS